MLDQSLVAGRNQRRHGEEVRHRRAVGGNDLVGCHSVALRDGRAQRRIARVARAIEVEIGDAEGKLSMRKCGTSLPVSAKRTGGLNFAQCM